MGMEGDEWYFNGSRPPIDYSYMTPTNINGVQYTSGPDGKAYVIDPTTGTQSLATQDQVKIYNNTYGSVYDVNDYAIPAPERPKFDAWKQWKQSGSPRPGSAFSGDFGTGVDNGLQNNFQRAASQNPRAPRVGGQGAIVKSLMRGR